MNVEWHDLAGLTALDCAIMLGAGGCVKVLLNHGDYDEEVVRSTVPEFLHPTIFGDSS